jgi:hypothetical protein
MNQATLDLLIARAGVDPLVGFALLAAGVVVIAGLVEALIDGEPARLKRVRTWVMIPLALLIALGLETARLWAPTSDLNLEPLVLAPLLVIAFAFGPLTGLILGGAWLGIDMSRGLFTLEAGHALLMLIAIGWIGLGRHRRDRHAPWLPATGILGAWLLASSTYSLALWGVAHPGNHAQTLASQIAPPGLMWVVLAFAVTLPPSGFWSWLEGQRSPSGMTGRGLQVHSQMLTDEAAFSHHRSERATRRSKRRLTAPVNGSLEPLRSLRTPRDSE